MATYNIPVENIEALRKAITRIQRKAEKYNCTVSYEETGEFFQKGKTEDGEEITRKYIIVEVEGEAKVNGWIFAGTIEHTPQGNILRSIDNDHKIPERYRDARPYCEHCNTKRARKDTYVVFNEKTQEYKQVGKSCLMDYTNGLSAETAAFMLQWVKQVENHCSYDGTSLKHYYNTIEISKYFVETMRKLGWASSSAGGDSTKEVAMDFYGVDHKRITYPDIVKAIEVKRAKINFDPDHIDDEYITKALNWAKSWDGHEYNDYRDNLKVIASMDYCEYKHLGYLASLFMAYDKEMEREVKRMERNKERAKSEHIGEIKERITCKVKSFKTLTAWETQWDTTFLYEFVTDDGNVLIWKTSKWLDDEKDITTITGTVKAHNEFRGIKQTELTRCKIA